MGKQEYSRQIQRYDSGMNPSSFPPNSQAAASLTYSVAETATILGVSPATIYRLLDRRLLKAVPGMRHKRISKKQVEALAEGTIG